MIIIHRKGERREKQNFFTQLLSDKRKAKKRRDVMAEEFANHALRMAGPPTHLVLRSN